METVKRDTEVMFSNYNYSFNYFFREYKELCLNISVERNIFKINRQISSFMNDFIYAITEDGKNIYYTNTIRDLYIEIKSDKDVSRIISMGENDLRTEIVYYKIYYGYLFKHLNILSEFIEDLTPSFMPHTNLQKKMIRFFNDQYFFDSFMQFKKVMIDRLVNFKLSTFFESYNTLLIFFSAYKLFINERIRSMVEDTLSIAYSMMMNKKVVGILRNYPKIGSNDKVLLNNIENKIYDQLHFCNSQINISFSNYGVLPKINRKIYIDKTLI